MTRKSGLGRGLDALLPSGESALPASGISNIPVDAILPNPRQPRSYFDPDELAELSASIKEHGVIQPLILTLGRQDGQYFLVAGERRLLAARQAGLETVPAIVREATEQQSLELALVENVQRADLGPLEAAEAYRQLSEDFKLSHEDIAARVGKSRVAITNTLRLLKLPEVVRSALVAGRISEGHARALLSLPTHQAQTAALHTILDLDLTVRQTEELARRLVGQKPPPPERPSPPPEYIELEERLRGYLGTKVNLNRRSQGGTLVIHYYSDEDLDNLVNRILKE
jgi:ParB family transcriptional regulator, chromosome partitioning protein